jgi:hypothetical protein
LVHISPSETPLPDLRGVELLWMEVANNLLATKVKLLKKRLVKVFFS